MGFQVILRPARSSRIVFGLLLPTFSALCVLPSHGQGLAGIRGQSGPIHTELLPAGLDAKDDGESFLFGVGMTGIYDSNIFLQENKEVSDFSIVASPWVTYRSAPEGGARFILGARYAPYVRAYLDNNNLNSLDHSGSASLSYEGAKLNLSLHGAFSRFSWSDRFAGTVVDASVINFGLDGSYQLSQKKPPSTPRGTPP